MSATTQDRPKLDPAKFSASLIETPGLPHNLTVSGQGTGDYRVEEMSLVRAHHQGAAHILVLDLVEKLGPVQNPHPEFIRLWPLEYSEKPAKHQYTEVKIVNGTQHFMVKVIDAL
jgi:hypothetical protein